MAVPWLKRYQDDDIRCEATVYVGDDRWGGWTNRCLLRKGHGGYHRHPLAFMAWTGTHDDEKKNDG